MITPAKYEDKPHELSSFSYLWFLNSDVTIIKKIIIEPK